MIAPNMFYKALKENNVTFFAGVPDSLLKQICAYISENSSDSEHLICANEGTALATAMGYQLATNELPLVYMQNSGLGNIVNPLTSLADKEVYSIPMLLMIGWRGEPGIKDEPQHVKMGRITKNLLDTLEVKSFIIDKDSDFQQIIERASFEAKESSSPVALLIKKGSFSDYKTSEKNIGLSDLSRESAINEILNNLKQNDLIVSTTGKTSRELYELREKRNEPIKDFLTVGGMGHTSSIAFGLAIGAQDKRVICLDGDGSLIMHMGAITNIGTSSPSNFIHILLNNSAHESVGGQKTVASKIDFSKVFKSSGFKEYFVASNKDEIQKCFKCINELSGPILFEIKIKTGSRSDLGRPKSTPLENKNLFISNL